MDPPFIDWPLFSPHLLLLLSSKRCGENKGQSMKGGSMIEYFCRNYQIDLFILILFFTSDAAIPAPIPELAPVTNATLPHQRSIIAFDKRYNFIL